MLENLLPRTTRIRRLMPGPDRTRRTFSRSVVLTIPVCAATATPAFAHAIIEREGGVLAFRATDFVSRNDVSVQAQATTASPGARSATAGRSTCS
jgi:hypothetical protein